MRTINTENLFFFEKFKNQVKTAKILLNIGHYFAPIVTFSLAVTKWLNIHYDPSEPTGFLNRRAPWTVKKDQFEGHILAKGRRYDQSLYEVLIGNQNLRNASHITHHI